MSVIKLDSIFLSELCESIVMLFFVSLNNVINGSRTEEILLLQSELLTRVCAVVWIQDTGDVLGLLSFINSTLVVT